MSLEIRKIIVISLIGLVFLAGNILIIANWLVESEIEQKADWIREHFLTGTAITIIFVLLILLVSPKNGSSKVFAFVRKCPVCDHRLIGSPSYCGDCGSKVS
jgi:membrane-bound acyltransferase YfiQ involved in biofilm formation